jgi:hypothetical protein
MPGWLSIFTTAANSSNNKQRYYWEVEVLNEQHPGSSPAVVERGSDRLIVAVM